MKTHYRIHKNALHALIILLVLFFIGTVSNAWYGYNDGYEQGHYDALKEAHETYGLEVDFDGYSEGVQKW